MDKTVSKLVGGFVLLLLGAILLTTIASTSNAITTQTYASNESVSIASTKTIAAQRFINSSVSLTLAHNNSDGWRSNNADCVISNFALLNQSGGALVSATDYNLNTGTGTLTMVNTLNVNNSAANTTTASYSYCGDTYLNSSFGRSGINVGIGLFAVSVMLTAVGLFYSVAKDKGII